MMPIAPLMIEHRLIERMIKVMAAGSKALGKDTKADVALVNAAVDFVRTYADKVHHGKEEDILFRDLRKKKLQPEHEKIMDELMQEHIRGRKTVGKLIEVTGHYAGGDRSALKEIQKQIDVLVEFYPKHIEKEDKHFFGPAMEYFSQEEQDKMLQEEYEFDRKFIHEKYKRIVEEMEGGK